MEIGQIIEYTMRNIFLEKSNKKCGGETSPRHFSEKSKLNISLDQQSKVLYNLFLLYLQVEIYQNLLKFAFTSNKAFLKNKKRSGISLLVSFSV